MLHTCLPWCFSLWNSSKVNKLVQHVKATQALFLTAKYHSRKSFSRYLFPRILTAHANLLATPSKRELPIFLLMDHFLYRFSTILVSEKVKKVYRLQCRSLNFCKMHHRIPFFWALCLSVHRFQMPLEGLGFVKTLITLGLIYATDPLLQNMTKIVCLHWLAFDSFEQ